MQSPPGTVIGYVEQVRREREREREHCQWREEERDEEEKKSGIGSLRERGEWHIASRCVIVILGCELCLSLVLIEEC